MQNATVEAYLEMTTPERLAANSQAATDLKLLQQHNKRLQADLGVQLPHLHTLSSAALPVLPMLQLVAFLFSSLSRCMCSDEDAHPCISQLGRAKFVWSCSKSVFCIYTDMHSELYLWTTSWLAIKWCCVCRQARPRLRRGLSSPSLPN